jgi:mono/diheme cytochrome c family protein
LKAITSFLLGAIFLYGASCHGESYADVRTRVFQTYCLDCHSQPGAAAGLDLGNYADLMSSGVIEPSKPDESVLYQKLEMGDMPKGGDPITPEELELVKDWIAAGAPDAPPAATIELKTVTPRFGPTTGKNTVELDGQFLSTVKEVYFGAEVCTDLKVVSDLKLTCTAPKQGAAGLVDVKLIDGSQEVELKNAYDYRLPLAATYESLRMNIFKPKCMRCHSGDKPEHGLDLSTYKTALSHRRAVIPYNLKDSRIYKKTSKGEMPRGGPRLGKDEVDTIGSWIRAGAPEK